MRTRCGIIIAICLELKRHDTRTIAAFCFFENEDTQKYKSYFR